MDELAELEREQDRKRIRLKTWRDPTEFKEKLSLRLGSLGAGNQSKRMLGDINYLLDEGLKRGLIPRKFYDESQDFIEKSLNED